LSIGKIDYENMYVIKDKLEYFEKDFQYYTKIFFVKYVRSGSGPTIPDQSRPRSSESGSSTLVLGPASELEEP
jgi:hypothetical protein